MYKYIKKTKKKKLKKKTINKIKYKKNKITKCLVPEHFFFCKISKLFLVLLFCCVMSLLQYDNR